MKCPSCGYNTFDTYERCKRCGARLHGPEWKDKVKVFDEQVEEKKQSSPFESKKLFDEQPVRTEEREDPVMLEEEIIQQARENYHYVSATANPTEDINQQDQEENMLTLASFMSRFFAFIFDTILIFLISFVTLIMGLYLAGYDPVKGMINLSYIIVPIYIILTLLASTYFLFLQAYSGKTIGKLVFGIRVVDEDGYSIGLSDSFIRWIGYFISAVPLFYGYISALFDINYQTWHDKLSKSYVIKDS